MDGKTGYLNIKPNIFKKMKWAEKNQMTPNLNKVMGNVTKTW